MKLFSIKAYPKIAYFSRQNPILRGMLIHDHSEPVNGREVKYFRQDVVKKMISKAVKEATNAR